MSLPDRRLISQSRNVSGTQLMIGILTNLDLTSTIMKFAQFETERRESEEELRDLTTFLNVEAPKYYQVWKNYAQKNFAENLADFAKQLPGKLATIANWTRYQLLQSARGVSTRASLAGLKTKYYSLLEGVDTLIDCLISIPQTIITNKAEYYWKKELAPFYPAERDAFMLYRLGKWSKSDYVNMLRETDGISSVNAEAIADMREWQIGKPSLRDAFYMVKKGIKPKSYFIELATKGYGFTRQDAEDYYTHLDYDLSLGELLRLSDLIPLESELVEKNLRAQGFSGENLRVAKEAIEKRQIRDEINKAWSLLLDACQWGLFSEKELDDLLTYWKFSKTERQIRIETANLAKTKLRVKLLRDAEIYLYRQSKIDENTLLTRLVRIGISKDIANAIVRYEAARKGIEWEITET